MKKPRLTQAHLKEILNYNPNSGIFKWKVFGPGKRKNLVARTINNIVGYVYITIDRQHYLASRLAFLWMEEYFPEFKVDHRNRVRVDNRWENLRHVNTQCNARNSSIRETNTSGITGVRWNKQNKNWLARIIVAGRDVDLGSFKSKKDAAQARWKGEKKYNFLGCNTTSTAFLFLQEEG